MKSQWIILTALILSASAIHSVQSCSAWDWVKCGGLVAACAAACVVTDGELCIECLGPSYHQCVSCFKVADEINALVTLQGAQGQICSAFDWVECGSKLFECEAACDDDLTAPKCTSCVGNTYSKCIYCLPPIAAPKLTQTELAQLSNCSTFTKIKCAAKVAKCATTCAENGITSSKCISCFGSAYKKCKGCVHFHTAVQAQLSSCSTFTKIKCAAKVAKCTATCAENGITSSKCISCFGSAYKKCKGCVHFHTAVQAQLSSCSTFTKIECAAKVAKCTATCAENGITSSKCISCFGSAYKKCKGCVHFDTEVQSVNMLQGCSSLGWLRCAGRLPSCTTECIDRGFNSPQCFHCLGSNFSPCNTCISPEDIEDMQQLAITQQAARENGVPKQLLSPLGVSDTLKRK